MIWNRDDSYLTKTVGKARKIEGNGDQPLPWWFYDDRMRPMLKIFEWGSAVTFGASDRRAKKGYRLGIIVDGHAYVGNETLNHGNALICLNGQDWVIFAVDPEGEVIPDEGGTDRPEKEFWVDISRVNPLDPGLSSLPTVD